MPLPAMLCYNDLDGSEVQHVVRNRLNDFLDTVPYFQRHLTFPRVRITTSVKLEVWADSPQPDVVPLNDSFAVVVEHSEPVVFEGESVDTAAPIAGGHPPDQIREIHGLPISQPSRGPRDIAITDQYPTLDGREVDGRPGLKISRTGSGQIDGMATSANATVAKIDQGPAGLRAGQMNREAWHLGGGRKE